MKPVFASLLLLALTQVNAAPKNPNIQAPGLLSTQEVRTILEQDPLVLAARTGLDIGQYEAELLEHSPYEWTVNATGLIRHVKNTSNDYKEWDVGVQKTFRLPSKAEADRHIGVASQEVSHIRYTEALRSASLILMSLWVDWLAAEQNRILAEQNLNFAQESLKTVTKLVQAGDASKLDLHQIQAEVADQKRQHNDAKTQANSAWIQLSTRFPTLAHHQVPLPMPQPIDQNLSFWRNRVITQSNALKVVQAQVHVAEAQAARAQADRIPDPTFGVFTASESGGNERMNGVTFSMPIPNANRNIRSAKAHAEVEVLTQEYQLAQRQLEADIRTAMNNAQGSYNSLTIAHEGAEAMRNNAALMQRAYALGETELQALLQARRMAVTALNNALQAQITALKDYYSLLINAHLIWDFEP